MKRINQFPQSYRGAFALPDLLVVLAVLMLLLAIVVPLCTSVNARSHLARCTDNLRQINGGTLSYAGKNNGRLPEDETGAKGPVWWFYKEAIKGELDLKGGSSPADKVFACPDDRGYERDNNKIQPFCRSAKFDYNSYVFNGVSDPRVQNIPNIAGRALSAVREPAVTLLVMEWTAHAPLSWHHSRTGKKNQPFYNDAESVVGFVDGHVDFIPIYYDGMNAAYTRDPIAGYKYKYSGD